MENNSITRWLTEVRDGDSPESTRAVRHLWEQYYGRLVRLAERKLRDAPRRIADGEDIATEAFRSFVRGVENGRFPQLDDRSDLWQVLLMLTERKTVDYVRRVTTEKRGGGRVRGESALAAGGRGDSRTAGWSAIADPSAEFASQLTHRFRELLDALGDDELKQITLDKLAGYTNDEIAGRQNSSLRTIERRIALIRRVWTEGDEHERLAGL